MRLAPQGICMAGPPCSLHVSASQSVHCRSEGRLLGNTRNYKVRLSNRIWTNFVPRLWSPSSRFPIGFLPCHIFGITVVRVFSTSFYFLDRPTESEFSGFPMISMDFMGHGFKAEFLRAILHRNILIAIEQPASSWAFRAHLQEVIILANLWLGERFGMVWGQFFSAKGLPTSLI